MQFERLSGKPTRLVSYGTIQNPIHGRLPPEAKQPIDASGFRYGFEAGSPRDLESSGELIVFNGRAYTRGSDNRELLQGDHLYTTACCTLSHEAEAALRVTCEESLSMEQLYEAIFKELGTPFAMAGHLSLESLRGMALIRPPIYDEYIFDRLNDYVEETRLSGVEAFVFGAAGDVMWEQVFYRNPMEAEESLQSHAHIALLEGEKVVDVYHIFGDSILSACNLEIFSVSGVI